MSLAEVAYGVLGGGLAGIATATSIAELGERGRQRAERLRELRSLIHDTWRVLAAASVDWDGKVKQPADKREWLAKQILACGVLLQELGPWRRQRVRRCMKRAFGRDTVRWVETIPPTGDLRVASRMSHLMTLDHIHDIEKPGAVEAFMLDKPTDADWKRLHRAMGRLARATG